MTNDTGCKLMMTGRLTFPAHFQVKQQEAESGVLDKVVINKLKWTKHRQSSPG